MTSRLRQLQCSALLLSSFFVALAQAQESTEPLPQEQSAATEADLGVTSIGIENAAPAQNPDSIDFGGPELQFQDQDEPELVAPDAASYQFYITDLENRGGPYADGLSEQLLGLGTVYQNQGLHQEAIKTFKRGIHLARINNGLYGAEQVPLLEKLIRSQIATGDYEAADERQNYLYRVQRNLYGENSIEMAQAMMRRAAWEWQAYNLQLTDTGFLRLLTMTQLYGNVLHNISTREGSRSLNLLDPLMGLLQTQYLILYYSDRSRGFVAGAAADPMFVEENQFAVLRASNYRRGQAAISALNQVYSYNEGETSLDAVSSYVQLGDWHLMHGKRDSARAAWQAAWEILGEREDAEQARAQFFGEPTLLPDLDGFPTDIEAPAVVKGYAEVSYYISSVGQVKNLELLDWDGADDPEQKEPIKLLRFIKYRPIMVDGETVATETIQKRYAY